jgi:DNA invertase Pin-like site-specific DNA recombinase
MTFPVGAYARMSLDREGDRLGVQRQGEDTHLLAKRLGWTVVREYEDNDLSGSGFTIRPGYSEMLADLEAGVIRGLVATEVSRYQRGHAEYVRWYELCEKVGAKVAWMGGLADFETGSGLMELELRAAFAREELRTLKRRMRRQLRQSAEMGIAHPGGRRPYGYRLTEREDGRRTLPFSVVDEEAEIIREVVRRALLEEPLRAIVRDLHGRGVPTVFGGPWRPHVLRDLLVSARISGRREIRREGDKRLVIGTIVADGNWPAIISVEDSDRLRALLGDPTRDRRRGYTRHLLTGQLAFCGRPECGRRMFVKRATNGTSVLTCAAGVGFSGCGRVAIDNERAEVVVRGAFFDAVSQGRLAAAIRAAQEDETATGRLYRDLEDVKARLKRYAGQMDAGELDEVEWHELRRRQLDRRARLEEQIAAETRKQGLGWLAAQLDAGAVRERWEIWTLHEKRAALKLLINRIVIHPASRRFVWDPSRIDIRWRV